MLKIIKRSRDLFQDYRPVPPGEPAKRASYAKRIFV